MIYVNPGLYKGYFLCRLCKCLFETNMWLESFPYDYLKYYAATPHPCELQDGDTKRYGVSDLQYFVSLEKEKDE